MSRKEPDPSSEFSQIQNMDTLTPKIKEMVRLRSLRRFFMFFLLPIVFSPIPLIIGTPPASCAYVIFVMGFFWVTETLPLPVTALIPTIAYPLLDIEPAEAVSSAYLNDSNMMFFGSMVMAVAVESSRLHERVALRTLCFTGANPRFLMLGLQVATAFISLWMSNTSTTTMMLPLVLALIKELDMCERLETESLNSSRDSADTVSQMLVLSDNKQQRRIYKGLLLSIAYASAIGGAGTLIGTSSIISMNSHFQSLYGDKNPVAFFSYMCYSIPQLIILLLICWIWLQFLFIGFCNNNKKNNQVVNDMIVKKYKELGPMRYEELVVLISFLSLIALWLSRPAWTKLFTASYVTDGTASMLISMLLFVLPAENPFSSATVDKLLENKDEPIRTIITWKLMREKFSWSTLFLLGGGFAMANGVKKSGLSDWIAIKLSAMQWMPPWAFIAFSSGIVCLLTEFASNTATAAVFIPVVASIAIAQDINPLTYVLPVTFASSFSFMFPSGTPPNAVVFSAKILHVSDMILGGLVLKIGSFILCQVFAQTFAPLVFDFGILNVTVTETTMAL
ncbi:unnamed protein product [Meloidogyne enterolobii]|uniref:Uncharacterized protein n=1 Tax=Meloidogyne enterolobii TaxID=390850 RepID=A0ACB1B466_MELEN